jgi:hypothetical protein
VIIKDNSALTDTLVPSQFVFVNNWLEQLRRVAPMTLRVAHGVRSDALFLQRRDPVSIDGQRRCGGGTWLKDTEGLSRTSVSAHPLEGRQADGHVVALPLLAITPAGVGDRPHAER